MDENRLEDHSTEQTKLSVRSRGPAEGSVVCVQIVYEISKSDICIKTTAISGFTAILQD